ncbi:MAG: hypothetical protein ACFFG0_17805, partial [Candidatus Thorarchaeota archaeon]
SNLNFYREAVKQLRQWPVPQKDGTIKNKNLVDGFFPKDGYDLRDIQNWTPSQKGKIKKYFKHISELTSRPNYIYKPRYKSHLRKAQEFSQQEKGFPNIKVAIIPTDGVSIPKITFTKEQQIKVKIGGMKIHNIGIDFRALLEDPESAVIGAINDKAPFANLFKIQAGVHEVHSLGFQDRKYIVESIVDLITSDKYQQHIQQDF